MTEQYGRGRADPLAHCHGSRRETASHCRKRFQEFGYNGKEKNRRAEARQIGLF